MSLLETNFLIFNFLKWSFLAEESNFFSGNIKIIRVYKWPRRGTRVYHVPKCQKETLLLILRLIFHH